MDRAVELRTYRTASGQSPFEDWFARLDPIAQSRVTVALTRLEQGNLSNTKSVGGGVLEYRIDFGPGYRLYFGRDGQVLIIMLAGGQKRRQQRDIDAAIAFWEDYRCRKRQSRR
jgi:putative addiction module killer protein